MKNLKENKSWIEFNCFNALIWKHFVQIHAEKKFSVFLSKAYTESKYRKKLFL